MRSPLILALVLLTSSAALVAVGAGCSDVSTVTRGDGGASPTAGGFDDSTVALSDGGSTSTPGQTVSRLCSAAPKCLPDDDGTFTPTAIAACPSNPVDGGEERQPCRIVAEDGPHCFADGTSDRDAIDGAPCGAGADCAPGFDCVLGAGNRASVCRRYCCAGSSACDEHMSQNGGKTFCDIQTLSASSTLVPVCMPIKQCTLLKPKECTSEETCAIVTDKGDTGCVTTGPQGETDPCDEAHCAAGLTCLGSAGARKCYKVCHIDDGGSSSGGPAASGCAASQKCTTGSLFPDTTYGVCRTN